jgi:hypothetical protein
LVVHPRGVPWSHQLLVGSVACTELQYVTTKDRRGTNLTSRFIFTLSPIQAEMLQTSQPYKIQPRTLRSAPRHMTHNIHTEWGPQTLRQACYRENPESAMCVQNLNDSRGLAIRITYRISLRSSSLWEPRHPPLKVVMYY